MTGLRASQQWARVVLSRQRIMLSLRLPLLATSMLATGCTAMMPFGSEAPPVAQPAAPSPDAANLGTPAADQAVGPKVGILLPLSGPNGLLGESMLRAAKLALSSPAGPVIDAHDTAGPGGAAQAARSAVQGGDAIILGPLTSGDTAAVAPIARAADIPVLAFTSDVTQAQPGIWIMGITPQEQVHRLVFAAKAEGRSRIAALLPSNAFGNALADGLTHACADAGLPPPTILTHSGTPDSIDATMKQLADLSGRQASIAQSANTEPAAGAASATSTPAAPAGASVAPGTASGSGAALPAGGSQPVVAGAPVPGAPGAVALPGPPLPPPPFDALLLGDTGLQLQEVIAALHTSGVTAAQVRVMGPGLWGAFASKLRGLSGAWYAASDPASRQGFVEQYQAAYHQSPKLLADYPYDAAALARSLAPTGYRSSTLTRQDGFAGVDGVFTLNADGHVNRALAIFQIQPGGGAQIVQAAPRSLNTGS